MEPSAPFTAHGQQLPLSPDGVSRALAAPETDINRRPAVYLQFYSSHSLQLPTGMGTTGEFYLLSSTMIMTDTRRPSPQQFPHLAASVCVRAPALAGCAAVWMLVHYSQLQLAAALDSLPAGINSQSVARLCLLTAPLCLKMSLLAGCVVQAQAEHGASASSSPWEVPCPAGGL
jgi:hypothetical protein